ncbi:hypothetical protein V6243_17115 [Cobetia marina]|uniref:DUF6708 domain-containing protein n=1 Tax=Cobetia marina TaxID=28258 RepID=A0ABU9GK96_COBMA
MNIHKDVLDGNYLITECNNHFLEVVGRENDSRGRFNFTAFIIGVAITTALGLAAAIILNKNVPVYLYVMAVMGGLLLTLFYVVIFFIFKYDTFKCSQYSVRFLRKERKVTAITYDGSTLTLDWDAANVEYTTADGKGSILTLVPGIVWLGDTNLSNTDKNQRIAIGSDMLDRKDILRNIWLIASDYMDRSDGIDITKSRINFCVPGSSTREGVKYGVLHGYYFCDKPLMKLMLAPIVTPMVLGRWLSIFTSKIPSWPKEILEVCQLRDDEETVNWKNYHRIPFWENEWVILCFSIGMIVDSIGVYYLIQHLIH